MLWVSRKELGKPYHTRIAELEKKTGWRELSVEQWYEKTALEALLMDLYKEEVRQQQRSRERCYFEGGSTTAYVDEESCECMNKLMITSLESGN